MTINLNQPRTVLEWAYIFVKARGSDAEYQAIKASGLLSNPVFAVNLHQKAFSNYIEKKKAKGLLKDICPEDVLAAYTLVARGDTR